MRWLIARILFYPTLAWNHLLLRLVPRRRWWDQVDEAVFLGALPSSKAVRRLYAEGVRAVVNTCEEYAGPRKTYKELGIEQLRIPTIDFTAPSLPDIQKAVAFMREYIARGAKVYVHCKAGRGRSATVVICWLMAEKGMSAEAAQETLSRCRPHVIPNLFRRKVVMAFEERQRQIVR